MILLANKRIFVRGSIIQMIPHAMQKVLMDALLEMRCILWLVLVLLFIWGWYAYAEQAVYTFYHKGNKRYNLTKNITIEELNEFKDFLLSSLATYECRCYSLNKERK